MKNQEKSEDFHQIGEKLEVQMIVLSFVPDTVLFFVSNLKNTMLHYQNHVDDIAQCVRISYSDVTAKQEEIDAWASTVLGSASGTYETFEELFKAVCDRSMEVLRAAYNLRNQLQADVRIKTYAADLHAVIQKPEFQEFLHALGKFESLMMKHLG